MSAENRRWYVLPKGKKKTGPFTLADLKTIELDDDVKVRRDDEQEWRSLNIALDRFPELKAMLELPSYSDLQEETRLSEREALSAKGAKFEPPQITYNGLSKDFGMPDEGPSPGAGGPFLDASTDLWNSGEYASAREKMLSALELGLTSPFDQANAHQHIAQVFAKEGELLPAIQHFCEALSIRGLGMQDAWQAANRLKYIYQELGLYSEAGILSAYSIPLDKSLRWYHSQDIVEQYEALARTIFTSTPKPIVSPVPKFEAEFLSAFKKAAFTATPLDWARFDTPLYGISYPADWDHQTGSELLLVPPSNNRIPYEGEFYHSPAITVIAAKFPQSVVEEPDFLTKQPALACEFRDSARITGQIPIHLCGYPAVAAQCSFSRAGAQWVQNVVYCLAEDKLVVLDASGRIEDYSKDHQRLFGHILASVRILESSSPKSSLASDVQTSPQNDEPEFLVESLSAEDALDRLAARKHDDDVIRLNSQAIERIGVGDYDGARALLERALDLNPRYVNALANMGASFMEQEQWAKAIPWFDRAVSINPLCAEAAEARALCQKAAELEVVDSVHAPQAPIKAETTPTPYRGRVIFFKTMFVSCCAIALIAAMVVWFIG